MKVTDKQAAAIGFISRNPGASITEIATAAGVSTARSNDAEFIRRLIDGGFAQIVLTPDTQAVMDDDADDRMDDAATALYAFLADA